MFSKNFDYLMKKENITNKKLAEMLDNFYSFKISKESIAKYRRGERTPNPDFIKYVSYILKVNVNELLKNENDNIPLTHYLPIIGEASCGVPTHQFFEDREMYPVSEDMYRNSRYIVRAVGDSMLPKIKNGDLVLCDKEAQIDNNSIIHYTINGEESGIKKAVYKDGKLFMLMPLNPDYPPIMLGENDEVVTAKCIKVISNL